MNFYPIRVNIFPKEETSYSIISKITLGIILATCLYFSIQNYKYFATSIWLNIFGIGAATEWFFNIGPKLDRFYRFRHNHCTFAGSFIIFACLNTTSTILHQIGYQWAIFIAGVCYIPDAGAYLIGNLIIKPLKLKTTMINPASPKKSWEALLGSIPISLFFNLYFIYPQMPKTFLIGFWGAFLVVFVGVFVGAFGDMFESWTKRKAGVKESSILLGPMGGFLDRIDSLLSVSIIFIIAFYLF
uniref:Phosphatidate cytidylyltransferase n=1 Tax=candidate division CPR3 bacterium TaxID=2268181 RepID=A0A7C4R2U1_UNCC3